MTTHIEHPDVHTHGLEYRCPRCRQLSERPEQELDERMIRRLLERQTFSALDVAASDRLRSMLAVGLMLERILHGEEVSA